MSTVGILDLLALSTTPLIGRVKLVRHVDRRYDVHDLFRRGWLDTYQAFQAKPVFHKADLLVSFIGLEDRRARMLGVYRVDGHRPGRKGTLPAGCPFSEWTKNQFYYALTRVSGFEAFEHRAVIDWGPAAIVWHQRASNKPVTELLPAGQLLAPFRDYLDFSLTFGELSYLVQHRAANAEWIARLEAVAGIYLILDSITGEQYVGSASGERGVWGRWLSYAQSGHGGNQLLRALVRKPGRPAALTFSLLQVLPRTTPKSELVAIEQRFKAKLGSRVTGLNAN
ncbi:MAG: GIY-YIG nuclease family protein [Vicinamibacterales bacterium]